MDTKEILKRVNSLPYWYHKINLGHGVVTPGLELDLLWNNLRKTRNKINYKGKRVLDICSFDGMFAFEAEKLGAKEVVATDCLYRSQENFLLCRQILKSTKTKLFYNVSPYNLVDRLDIFFGEDYGNKIKNYYKKFDIVQHLGLLYHLRDPMYSLSQARSVLKTNGKLLIETDIILNEKRSVLSYNGLPDLGRYRNNSTVWWLPSKLCLFEMLKASLFRVEKKTYREFEFKVPQKEYGKISKKDNFTKKYKLGRCSVVATAVTFKDLDFSAAKEISRTFRNPGLYKPFLIP